MDTHPRPWRKEKHLNGWHVVDARGDAVALVYLEPAADFIIAEINGEAQRKETK